MKFQGCGLHVRDNLVICTCNDQVASITDPDWSVELLRGDGNGSLAALAAEQSPAATTMMFPSSEPELRVAAHAGAGRVVGDPERGPLRVRVVHRLPRHLARRRLDAGPSVVKRVLVFLRG